MAKFPCPNASCNYQFDQEQLPAQAIVTCPLCGKRFAYRVSPTGQPMIGTSTKVPAVGKTASAAPSRLVSNRVKPVSEGLSTWMMVGLFTAFLVIGLAILYFSRQKGFFAGDSTPAAQSFTELNFSYQSPSQTWENDERVRNELRTTFALKRTEPDAWIAIYAEDFNGREANTAVMITRMKERLQKFFGDATEIEAKEKTTWSDQPAEHFIFRGRSGDQLMLGETYVLTYKGIGYIYFAWSVEENAQAMEKEFLMMRDRFRLGTTRERWEARKTSDAKVFRNEDWKIQLEDREAIWKEEKPEEENPFADKKDTNKSPPVLLQLRAKYPVKNAKSKGVDFVPTAEVKVIAIEKTGDDGLAAARKYVEDTFKQEAEAAKTEEMPVPWETKIEEVTELPGSTATSEVQPLLRLKTTNSVDRNQRSYIVISVLAAGDKWIVCEGRCKWSDFSYMEPYLNPLVASLQQK